MSGYTSSDEVQRELSWAFDAVVSARSPNALGACIEQVGNALRTQVPIGSKLRTLICETPLCEITAALDAYIFCSFPSLEEQSSQDAIFEQVLSRDRLESLRLAVVWIGVVSRRVSGISLAQERVRETIAPVENWLKLRVHRSDAEDMMGHRVSWLGNHPWTDVLEEPKPRTESLQPVELLLPDGELPIEWQPPPRVTAEYVSRGLHQQLVEQFAKHCESYKKAVLDLIGDTAAAGEPVGLVARRWHATQQRITESEKESQCVIDIPLLKWAASGGTETVPQWAHEAELGRLAPLEAEAVLVVADAALELEVCAAPLALSEVRLGEVSTSSEASEGRWVVRVPVRDTIDGLILPMMVRASNGKTFEALLRIVPGHVQ